MIVWGEGFVPGAADFLLWANAGAARFFTMVGLEKWSAKHHQRSGSVDRSQNHPLLPPRPRAVFGGGARAPHTDERTAVRSRSLTLGGDPPLAGRVGGFGLVLLELHRPRTRDAQSARPAQGIGYHGIVSHRPQPDLYRRIRRPGGLGLLVAFPANPAHVSHLFRCVVPVRNIL